jgi:HSP20 family protein
MNFILPGITVNDVHIEIVDNVLSLTGEIKKYLEFDEIEIKSEREYGKFGRSFRLPKGTNKSDVTAAMKSGILSIKINKNS